MEQPSFVPSLPSSWTNVVDFRVRVDSDDPAPVIEQDVQSPVTNPDLYASGVDYLEWRLNGGQGHQEPAPLNSLEGDASTFFHLNASTGLVKGVYELETRVVDVVGFPSAWVHATLQVDRDQPKAPVGGDATSLGGNQFRLFWGAVSDDFNETSNVSGIARYEWEIIGVNGLRASGANSVTSDPLPNGSYRFHVRAVDNAGNVGDWSAEFPFSTQHPLSIGVSPSGTGSAIPVPNAPSYAFGTLVSVTATPITGWHFTNWTGDAGSSSNALAITMDRDKAITANFAINQYSLTLSTDGLGSLQKVPDAPLYDHGTTVRVDPTPATGWHFTGWTGDASGSDDPLGVYMDRHKSITGHFGIDSFTIVATAGPHGAISPSGPTIVTWSSDQTFIITPDDCYHIEDVVVDGVSKGPISDYTFTDVKEHHTITATFAIDTYTITASAGLNGSIAPTGTLTVGCGTSTSFTITPEACHFISQIILDEVAMTPQQAMAKLAAESGHLAAGGAILADATTVTFNNVRANHTIRAVFERSRYTIVATASPGGAIAPAGDIEVACGSDQSFTMTADPYHHLADVLMDDVELGPRPAFTFTRVRADHTIHAEFDIDEYPLLVTVQGQGTVARVPDQPLYDHGTNVVLTATPEVGWHFVTWSGDASGTNPVTTVLMDGPKSVTATFAINQYALATPVVGLGMVARSPDQPLHDHGTTVGLIATPEIGWHFVGRSGDASGNDPSTSVLMDGPKSVTATFAINQYTLATQIVGLGDVAKSPDQPLYDHGTNVGLSATPEVGWHFVAWSGDASGSNPVTTVLMNGPKSVTATFAINQYALATPVVGLGVVARSPDQPLYDHGTTVGLSATPEVGWHFVAWSGDASGTNPVTTVLMDGPKSVTATFAINQYTLATQIVGLGTVAKSPDQPLYDHGTNVGLTATPQVGWHFVAWSGDASGTNPATTVLMDGAKSVTATFAINQYALATPVVGQGSVARAPDQALYVHGTSVALSATPAVGWHFVAWSGDASGTNPATAVLMDGPKSATATFAINQYPIQITALGLGQVNKSPPLPLHDHGSTVTLTATPEFGWHFVAWSGAASGTNPTAYVLMDGPKSVTATFEINQYPLTVTILGQGTVARVPDQPLYNHDTVVTLTESPATGWHFVGWSGDATGTSPVISVIMNAPKAVTATFGITFGVDIKPSTLNLESQGQWITCFLTVPAPFSADDLDLASIRLNGIVPISRGFTPHVSGDRVHVKFDREAVGATLAPGDQVPVWVTGTLGGFVFGGVDYIRVISPHMTAPAPSTVVAPGTAFEVRWELPPPVPGETVTLLLSRDDGANWAIEAESLPNEGHWMWTVPDEVVPAARLAVVRVWGQDETGFVNESEYSESGRFSIGSSLGAAPVVRSFGLEIGNPARPGARFSVFLPDPQPAKLALFDITGRMLDVRSLEGSARQDLAIGPLRPGVYVVRLSQGARTITRRFVSVR